MTVRVRQLSRVSTGRLVPPIPPVEVTMFFIQQPTDTPVGELFNPPITVQVSDHRPGDVLILSMSSGSCAIGTISAVTDANGIATFNGLRAGSTAGEGCSVEVRNDSRPNIRTIVSELFNVTTIPERWSLINRANSGVLAQVQTQVTLNSTGANLILVQTIFRRVAFHGQPAMTDNFGNTYQPHATFVQANAEDNNWYLRAYSVINPIVGPGHTFIFGYPPGTGTPFPYPLIAVEVFRGNNPQLAIEGPSYGDFGVGTTFHAFSGGANITFDDALCFSAFAAQDGRAGPVVTPPPDYDLQIAYFDYLFSGFRIRPNPGLENPTWFQSSPFYGAMNLLVFRSA